MQQQQQQQQPSSPNQTAYQQILSTSFQHDLFFDPFTQLFTPALFISTPQNQLQPKPPTNLPSLTINTTRAISTDAIDPQQQNLDLVDETINTPQQTSQVHIYALPVQMPTSQAQPNPSPIPVLDYDIELANQAPYANIAIQSGLTVVKKQSGFQSQTTTTTTTSSTSPTATNSTVPIVRSNQLGNSIHFTLPTFTTLQLQQSIYSIPASPTTSPSTTTSKHTATAATNEPVQIPTFDKIPFYTIKTTLDPSIRLLSYASIRSTNDMSKVLSSATRKLVDIFTNIAKQNKIIFDPLQPQNCQAKSRSDTTTTTNQTVDIVTAPLYNHSDLSKNDDRTSLAVLGQKEQLRSEERTKLLQQRLYSWSNYIKHVNDLFGMDNTSNTGPK